MAVNGTREIRVRRIDRLGWMTTFSDMVTLLLTFFVMIIAMSSMDRKSLEDAFGFFRSVAGPLYFPSRGSVDIRP
ncbi:MAG TPA: flagellar motor protein MotB, partial [Deltaproteobacteria bacterium]|nr:flagellar motor protein MotB [Deltaproteobacteria bacterium]